MRNFYVHSRKSLVLLIVIVTFISIVICCSLYKPLSDLTDSLNEAFFIKGIAWLPSIGYAFHPLSFSATFATLWFFYDRFLWKILAHFGLLTNLNGTWCGYITSSYGNGKKLYCVTTIKQSFSTIFITTRFRENIEDKHESSFSDGFNFNIASINNKKYVSFSYSNVKRKNASPDIEHPGFNYFYLVENCLDGQYCTFRNERTFGEIKLVKVDKKTKYNEDIWQSQNFTMFK